MRHRLVVLPLSVALLLTACARSATWQSVSRPDSTPPNFVARVVTACRASGVYPGIGPNWQVELVVAISPAREGNAGVVVGRTTPVSVRRGAGSLSATPPDSFVSGDELEVWHDGSYALGAVQSPPGTPAYTATRIVIHRRGDRGKRSTSADTLAACNL